ncbi:MAG: ribonuclease III [Clostridia bacterium]|nr:ribonuclease III [Clostridia bacterium]
MELVDRALTHPSYAHEHPEVEGKDNQRLEFLGDAVLGVVVSDYLFRRLPTSSEGNLSKIRASIVCEKTLADVAREIGLSKHILLGRGEALSGGRDRDSILADAMEALIAAVYLAGGLEAAYEFVVRLFGAKIDDASAGMVWDYKTKLQEEFQERFHQNVAYTVLEELGPEHNKHFTIGVSFKGRLLAKGQGRSKREAEQNAAHKALDLLERGLVELE